jgi:3D (Asp-Asp-Asp) domain-containing protein
VFRLLVLLSVACLSACTTTREPDADPAAAQPQPSVTGVVAPPTGAMTLWATNYYAHVTDEVSGGVPLLSTSGEVLARISEQDYCPAAIEGTAIVSGAGGTRTLNYERLGSDSVYDCSSTVPANRRGEPWVAALGRSRWVETDAAYGLGVSSYKLVPYKTIAVDRSVIPIGTVVFIPQAKGITYDAGTGPQVHDGYFLAADVGGAIKGNHIDIFTGLGPNQVFPFVKSRESATFDALIVDDPGIRSQLIALHR